MIIHVGTTGTCNALNDTYIFSDRPLRLAVRAATVAAMLRVEAISSGALGTGMHAQFPRPPYFICIMQRPPPNCSQYSSACEPGYPEQRRMVLIMHDTAQERRNGSKAGHVYADCL